MNRMCLFIFILLVACQKEDVDPEASMETGNAILFNKCEVIDTSSSHLTAIAEFIVFDGLESTYGNGDYSFSGNDLFDTQTEILSSYNTQKSNQKPYNNLILINTDNKIWLERYSPGYYLERYFRQLDSTSSSALLVAYGKESNNQPVFYNKNSGLFSDSASDHSSAFYDVTRTENLHNSNKEEDNLISLQATVYVLTQLVDSLSQYSSAENRQFITLFLNGRFDDTTNADALVKEFSEKALNNNVSVHVFTDYSLKYDLQIAQLTGGFLYSGLGCLTSIDEYVPCYNQRVKGLGVILQNLHNILSMEYKTHVAEFIVSKTDTAAFTNLDLISGGINFKDFIYPFVLRK